MSLAISATASQLKRRILMPSGDNACTYRRRTESCSRTHYNTTHEDLDKGCTETNECAKLVTTNAAGRREVVVIDLNVPVVIGRNPRSCTYVVDSKFVSKEHCRMYAVLSSTGGVLVSCQDTSTNGTLINGQRLRKSAAIVMDGDEIEIPFSQRFKCIHILKEPRERMNMFDPTPPEGAYKNISFGRYTVMSHCLGSGSFASVHLAFDIQTCRQVACKTVLTKVKHKNELQKVMKEVNILRSLRHPNINRIIDIMVDDRNNWLHIFLELCTGGDLFTYISHNFVCEGQGKYIMYQIFKGVSYLHDKSIAHRDLKPENILLFSPGPYPRIQIADFGLARTRSYQETLNVCGTVAYLPPEGVLALDKKDLGYTGMPADCWSAGVILYTMLSGAHPFDNTKAFATDQKASQNYPSAYTSTQRHTGVSELVLKKRIVDGTVEFDKLWDEMPEAKLLVAKLLIYDPLLRETVYGSLSSPWFTSEKQELEQAYLERIINSVLPGN